MKRVLCLIALLWAAPAFATDFAISANTCGTPANSASVGDPYTTSFSLTVASGDTLAVVVVTTRMVVKTVTSIVHNGTDTYTKAIGTLGNTMGAEIWYFLNPTAATGNVVVTYANGDTYVWDQVCAMTFKNQPASLDDTDSTTHDSSTANISLSALTSTVNNSIFIDALATNSGFATMTAETNRLLRMDGTTATFTGYGSSIIVKATAGSDTMPYTFSAVSATEVGAVFKPVAASSGFVVPLVGKGGLVGAGGLVGTGGLK